MPPDLLSYNYTMKTSLTKKYAIHACSNHEKLVEVFNSGVAVLIVFPHEEHIDPLNVCRLLTEFANYHTFLPPNVCRLLTEFANYHTFLPPKDV